jgi:hypothetical protein
MKGSVVRHPLPFFWTPLQELLEWLHCHSTPLFPVPGSFIGALSVSPIETQKPKMGLKYHCIGKKMTPTEAPSVRHIIGRGSDTTQK